MAERGKVIWFKNGFGRVSRPDDTEAFMPPGTFPRGEDLAKGDELEFDVEPNPGPARAGEFLAKNVKIVSKVPRAGPAPSPKPAPKPTTPPPALSVSIKPAVILRLEGKNFLPVMVEVKQAGAVAPDRAVELLKNNKKAEIKPSIVNTKSDGVAKFLVPVADTEVTMKLTAKVNHGVYIEIWERTTSAAKISVLPEGNTIETFEDNFLLDISTRDAAGNGQPAKVQLRSDTKVTLVNADTGNLLAKNIKTFELETGANGRLSLRVSFRDIEANIKFALGTAEIISKRLYLR